MKDTPDLHVLEGWLELAKRALMCFKTSLPPQRHLGGVFVDGEPEPIIGSSTSISPAGTLMREEFDSMDMKKEGKATDFKERQ